MKTSACETGERDAGDPGRIRDRALRAVDPCHEGCRVDTRPAIRDAQLERAAADADNADAGRRRVVLPQPEDEPPGAAARGRVEDDVVRARRRLEHADDQAVVAFRRAVRVRVVREGGQPGESVLVCRADDARLDRYAVAVRDDRDAEVRDATANAHSVDDLAAG